MCTITTHNQWTWQTSHCQERCRTWLSGWLRMLMTSGPRGRRRRWKHAVSYEIQMYKNIYISVSINIWSSNSFPSVYSCLLLSSHLTCFFMLVCLSRWWDPPSDGSLWHADWEGEAKGPLPIRGASQVPPVHGLPTHQVLYINPPHMHVISKGREWSVKLRVVVYSISSLCLLIFL